MGQEKKKRSAKRTVLFVIGALLIMGTLAGGNLKHIINWSTAELIGYNSWTIFAIFGGMYMVYLGIRGK
jgi:hypothetical protein